MTDLKVHTAPPDSGVASLGRTLPGLLYGAVETWGNAVTLSDRRDGAWVSIGLDDFRRRAEALAIGLLGLGLARGDRVALFMESDVDFCLADMACLIAGLVDVPIYLTHTNDSIAYVIEHSGARTLVLSNNEQLRRVGAAMDGGALDAFVVASDSLPLDAGLSTPVHRMADLEIQGRSSFADDDLLGTQIRSMLDAIQPGDLATLIYTSGTTGVPKGVMLSHENISFDALTSFSGMKGYRRGPTGEISMSFLPLTHVFARALYYGFIDAGNSIFFSTPDAIGDDLKDVSPTVFAAVPRVIEKVYARFLERGAVLPQPKRGIFEWALRLARAYRVGEPPRGLYRVKLAIADRLVYAKWREGLGDAVRYVICGGAALSAELANIFAAAGIPILQGYGLTETSPVIAFNRPHMNRAGTVGLPIPGVEVAIAEDGEIVTRGPHIMLGYYEDPDKTSAVIDSDGWFHTGDIGEFDDAGYLRITDRKKDLFKLSTGKYVMPQPLEHRLAAEALIDQAVVLGIGRKYCTALIFPSESALRTLARTYGLPTDLPLPDYFENPRVRQRFQQLVDKANGGMDHWSTIKRFALIDEPLSVESGLLTPTLKVKRAALAQRFESEIDQLYAQEDRSDN